MASTRQNSTSKEPASTVSITATTETITAPLMSPASSADVTPVRRSTRDIKRKKFDDDFIDSGISSKTSRKQRNSVNDIKLGTVGVTTFGKSDTEPSPTVPAPPQFSPTLPPPSVSTSVPTTPVEPKTISPSSIHPATSIGATVQPPSTSKGKKGRSNKKAAPIQPAGPTNAQLQEQAAALKDVGRWQPIDDLALITAVMQTSDIKAVYTGVKFSCKFTLEEIVERWYALLYDQMISKLAQEAMRQLPPDLALSVQSNTLFSKNEERLISTVPSNTTGTVEMFNDLLTKHPDVFHTARTGRVLLQHWLQMRQHRLLADQKPLALPQGDYVMNFSDLEENFTEADVPPSDPLSERELVLAERHLTRKIRQLENELPKWHVLVESATGVVTPDFDANTIAILRGRLVRYLMRSKEVTVGRNARGYQVDIDLALEGPAFKVSRRQATIKLRATGEFYMINEGKRPMYIDGKPLLPGSKAKLNNNVVIEIACLRLLFLVNQELINSMRTEAAKMMIS